MSALELVMMKRVGELNGEVKLLKAEVERLRKAGDAVVADLEYLTKSRWFDKCKSVKGWNAAKDGKPSA